MKPPSESKHLLLDKFSTSNLKQWRRFARKNANFQLKLFYYLESLRAIHHKELCAALSESGFLTLNDDNWWRCVDFRYSDQPLSAKGSLIEGGRFNIGDNLSVHGFQSFPALYIAENSETAQAEKFGISTIANSLNPEEFALRDAASFSSVRLKFSIDKIFDLTRPESVSGFCDIIRSFKMTKDLVRMAQDLKIKKPYLVTSEAFLLESLLDEDWRHRPVQYDIPANSQVFARLLKEAGARGILYPAQKNKTKNNLVLFIDNFQDSQSWIALQDKAPKSVAFSRVDATNYKQSYQ